jgi:hypothetical protein
VVHGAASGGDPDAEYVCALLSCTPHCRQLFDLGPTVVILVRAAKQQNFDVDMHCLRLSFLSFFFVVHRTATEPTTKTKLNAKAPHKRSRSNRTTHSETRRRRYEACAALRCSALPWVCLCARHLVVTDPAPKRLS